MLHERHFKAMNTQVGVWLQTPDPAPPVEFDQAAAFFEQVEQTISRFRKDSDLMRLNAASGQGPQPASEILRSVTRAALEAARATEGLFDPAVLAALEAAGYSESFEKIKPEGRDFAPVPRQATWRDVAVTDTTIALPEGVRLDLGGVGKGWTVDRLAERLMAYGPVMVDAGGDIRALGRLEEGAWPVGVGDPFKPERDLVVVQLEDAAIATSSVGKRRWQRDGKWMHHLIDPRTMRPAVTDLHTVSVVGPRAMTCEIHSKVAILLGSKEAVKYLEARGLNAVLVRDDASVITAGPRFARQTTV